ncbi:TPA: hypothetical protein G9F26_004547 [Salmonella enterica]|uniref:Tail fibre protein gp37 trimerization region domain-containing protein n=1 Tax=Salmonella enterica TaxID=28901 RepID=A0A750MS57_SALER|nr:hypothetical protein [Salmonella enterica]
MKPLMPPIDTPDQVFHDGDPSIGELGTICSAEWLNNVQGNIRNIQAECIAILKANGFEPDETKQDQLWKAIQAAIKSQVPAASLTTAGITQLSSSVTSDSETIAATLKAVKIVMDNASARMAKDRNGADIPNKALFRQNLELGNSATLNTGTTAGTVAAGDDARILASQKAITDTQTGLAIQGVMWISTADDLSNLPAGARRFARNNDGVTVLPAAGYFFLEVLAKRDSANGSCILATSDTRDVWIGLRYTVPDEVNFTWIQLNQNVENLGLTEAVNRALNAVQKNGDIMTGNLFLKNDDRMHFAIFNEDGNARMWLYKDKDGDGIRINNGADGGGEFIFHKNGEFYSPAALHAGGATVGTDGNVNGSVWGGWLNNWLNSAFASRDNNINGRATIDWVNQNFITRVMRGSPVNPGKVNEYGPAEAPAGCVVTSVRHDPTTAYGIYFTYRPLSVFINGGWRVIEG